MQKSTPFPPPALLSEKDAARYLGLSPITLRQQRSDGARDRRVPVVPFVRMGRAIRYAVADLDAFIASHRIAA